MERKIQKIGALPLFSKKNPPKRVEQKSDYQTHLLERQKLRKNFLLTKKQLRNLIASSQSIRTSKKETAMSLVNRLDCFIYFMAASNHQFPTLRSVRQAIRHGFVRVNGRREKRPQYHCQPTDHIRCLTSFSRGSNTASFPYTVNYQKLRTYFDKF